MLIKKHLMSIWKLVYAILKYNSYFRLFITTAYLIHIICNLIGMIIFYIQFSWKLAYEWILESN